MTSKVFELMFFSWLTANHIYKYLRPFPVFGDFGKLSIKDFPASN